MKKILLASAIAAASVATAQAAPTVYGKAFLTADYLDTTFDNDYKVVKVDVPANTTTGTAATTYNTKPGDVKTTKLDSNSSRIGIKGSEPLTANTDVIYQLEYGVDIDSNNNNGANQAQFYSRNTYLGVSNKQYGTVMAGRLDTPYKTSKGDVDVFNTQNTLELDNAGGVLGETRANNVIAYKSPKLYNMPVTFMAAVSLSENDTSGNTSGGAYQYNGSLLNAAISPTLAYTNSVGATNYEKSAKDSAFSTSLVYDKDGIYAAAAYDKNVGIEDTAWRIAGSVDMGKMNMVQGLTLGALYQNVNVYDRKDDSKSWLISGKYKIANTPWTAKAMYVSTDNGSNNAAGNYLTDTSHGNYMGMPSKITEIAVGGEYAFNRNATGHIYAGRVQRDHIADTTIVGTGLEYKF